MDKRRIKKLIIILFVLIVIFAIINIFLGIPFEFIKFIIWLGGDDIS